MPRLASKSLSSRATRYIQKSLRGAAPSGRRVAGRAHPARARVRRLVLSGKQRGPNPNRNPLVRTQGCKRGMEPLHVDVHFLSKVSFS